MTEPAAGWSVSRNRYTNEASISPGSAVVPNILASLVPDEAPSSTSSLEATESLVTELPKEVLACRSHIPSCPLSSVPTVGITDTDGQVGPERQYPTR